MYSLFKPIVKALLSCRIPRFDESTDSSSDRDSEEEEPAQKVITKLPTKKVDIQTISKESSLSDVWLYVDNGEKDVNNQDRRPIEIENSHSYKQKKKTEQFNLRETATNSPKSFKDLNLFGECIRLKILRQEEDIHVINEFMISVKEIKKKFQIIKGIIPRNADVYKKVPHSAKACIILFRFYFCDKFFISNTESAIETFVLARHTQANQLLHECEEIIAPSSYVLLNMIDILNTSYCYIGFSSSSSSSGHDIFFPLSPIQLSLNEAFPKDIINTATIESEKDFYSVLGVELCFNTENRSNNLPLTIIYNVSGDNFSFDDEVQVNLRPSINISFDHDFFEGQNVRIKIIVQDIKPSLCFSSVDEQFVQKTLFGTFCVTLSSSRKTDSDVSLFYLKKIYVSKPSKSSSQILKYVHILKKF